MPADVVLVTPDIVGPVKNGGIGTACFHYARSLARAGISVDILFTGEVPSKEKTRWAAWYQEMSIGFLSLADVPCLEKHTYGCTWYTERSLRLHNYLKNCSYKYILFQDWHGNGFWTARAKRMGCGFADVRIGLIAHSPNEWQREGMEHHGDEPFERADMEWIEKETIAAVDVLISPSQHMLDWLVDHDYSLPADTVRCPITFEDEIVGTPAEGFDPNHIIFFGRLETRKGLHLLGQALVDMKAGGDRLPRRVSLLGKYATVEGRPTGEYLAGLQQKLPEIEFYVENDFSYAQAVDYIRHHNGLVVLPSLLDNFPLTVVESITNGFFFIASAIGGIPEIADPSVTFEPNAAGLRAKLSGRHSIEWGRLRHPYDPAAARETWLEHIRMVLGNPGQDLVAPAISTGRADGVSVCIPFYRHDVYLERVVTAFLRVQDPAVQLVVVNDGTPESELESFNDLADVLSPLGHVFHSQDNAGPGAARNQAVRLAAHDLILFFDADNVPFPGMPGRLLSALRASGADSISAPFAAVPVMTRMPFPSDVWFHFIPPGGSAVRSLVDNVLGDMSCLIKRDVFEQVGGFNIERRSWEDWEFFLKMALRGFRHMVYPSPQLFYTHNPNGRNEMARGYHNRLSLLDSLKLAPPDRLADMLSILVRDQLVRSKRV